MMAPVAAPHAAPWPTGVSHDVSMQQLAAMTELTVRILVRIIRFSFAILRSGAWRSRRPASSQPLSVEPGLGINEDLLRTHVEHQPAVVNLRAVILFMRRIWAGNNAGRIMRVASGQWIGS